jgi:antitoxin ParD1/3/4
MATRKTLNISLTPALGRFVEKRVASGGYTSASEVVREGLRLLEQRDIDKGVIRSKVGQGMEQARRGQLLDGGKVMAELCGRIRSSQRRRKAG